jgi:hypothetical protein
LTIPLSPWPFADDPARALVLSYRVENYGHAMPEIFSLDLHKADQEVGAMRCDTYVVVAMPILCRGS